MGTPARSMIPVRARILGHLAAGHQYQPLARRGFRAAAPGQGPCHRIECLQAVCRHDQRAYPHESRVSNLGSANAEAGGASTMIAAACRPNETAGDLPVRHRPVLVVSGDLDAQDLYVRMLRRRRVPAHGVAACEDAVRLTTQIHIPAFVVEINCPVDWCALRTLRRRLPAAGIIVLSGSVRAGHLRLARRLGCGFLHVPCSAADLFEAVTRAVDDCQSTQPIGDGSAVR